MSVDILGTIWDQCVSIVQYCFTSTEIIRLVRTDSPGRPPRLSHSSWTLTAVDQTWHHLFVDHLTSRMSKSYRYTRTLFRQTWLNFTYVRHLTRRKREWDDHLSTGHHIRWKHDFSNLSAVHFPRHKRELSLLSVNHFSRHRREVSHSATLCKPSSLQIDTQLHA